MTIKNYYCLTYTIKFFERKTEKCLYTLLVQSSMIWSIFLMTNGLLVTGTINNTIRIFDFDKENAKCIKIIKDAHS